MEYCSFSKTKAVKILHLKFTQLLESQGMSLAWFTLLPTLRETNVAQMGKKKEFIYDIGQN